VAAIYCCGVIGLRLYFWIRNKFWCTCALLLNERNTSWRVHCVQTMTLRHTSTRPVVASLHRTGLHSKWVICFGNMAGMQGKSCSSVIMKYINWQKGNGICPRYEIQTSWSRLALEELLIKKLSAFYGTRSSPTWMVSWGTWMQSNRSRHISLSSVVPLFVISRLVLHRSSECNFYACLISLPCVLHVLPISSSLTLRS
jgi:hypothetical protein